MPTATSSATRSRRRRSASTGSTCRRAQPVPDRRGQRTRAADDEIVIDRGIRRRGRLRRRRRRSRCSPSGRRPRSRSPASPRSARPTHLAARPPCCSPTPMPQEYLSAPGQVDGIAVRAVDGVSEDEIVDRLTAAVPDLEVVSGRHSSIAEDQAAFQDVVRSVPDLPAGVRLRRRVRRCVHDQQHLLDHRRPTHPAARDAACAGCQPPSGAADGHGRSGRDRRRRGRLPVSPPASGSPPGSRALFDVARRRCFPRARWRSRHRRCCCRPRSASPSRVVSAWLPARRAGKVPPIAALRDVAVDRTGSSKRRPVIGTIVTAIGVAALLAGLGGGGIQLVGLGALVSSDRCRGARPGARAAGDRGVRSRAPSPTGSPARWR